jgi:ATP-dependent Clp protease ATP-binding subunit ClpA
MGWQKILIIQKPTSPSGADSTAEDVENKKPEKALDKYAVNLNEKAAEGKIDPFNWKTA